MARNESGQAIATEPVRVDVRSVEAELAGLWRRAVEAEPSGPVTRALIANLLVYAATDAEAEAAGDVILSMAADHPVRAVIADAEPGEPGRELEAEVSMLCSASERGRRLCGEEIRLHAHGTGESALGTIVPVLAPDLPVYLWTPGSIAPADEVLHHLADISEHWIMDSRGFDSWRDSLETAASVAHEPPIMLHDLAWVSLAQLREVTAQHFDPQPAREYLPGVTSVNIIYRPIRSPGPAIEAVLMAAWMISQLEWEHPRVDRSEDGRWTITSGDNITINLLPDPEARSNISEIVIEAETDGRRGVFRSVWESHADEVSLEADAPGVPDIRRTIITSPPDLSREVCQVLDNPGRDALYQRALPTIRSLVEQIEARF